MADKMTTATNANQVTTSNPPARGGAGTWDHLTFLAVCALTLGAKAPHKEKGATQAQVVEFLVSPMGALLCKVLGVKVPTSRQTNNNLYRLAPKGDNPQQGLGVYQATKGDDKSPALITRVKEGATWFHKVDPKGTPNFPQVTFPSTKEGKELAALVGGK